MPVLELVHSKPDLSKSVEQQQWVVLESEVQPLEADAVDTAVEVVKEQSRSSGVKKYLTAAALGISVVGGVVSNPAIAGLAIIGGFTRIAAPRVKKTKHGKLANFVLSIASLTLAAPLAMNAFAAPADALIFNNAQTAFTTAFPLAGTVIPIIFNIFRAVYITYLLYTAISIWTSYQRDEDWMSAAKAPVIVFVAAELTDAVAQMIFA